MKKVLNVGDCFVHKIKDNEKYKDKYIILQYAYLGKESKDYNPFYIRITNKGEVPSTYQDIVDADPVMMSLMDAEDRYNIIYASMTLEETKAIVDKIPFYPDDHDYLHIYFVIMIGVASTIHRKFKYIGNFELAVPKDSYVPFGFCCVDYSLPKNLERKTIRAYEGNNLRKYTHWQDDVKERKKRKAEFNDALNNFIQNDLKRVSENIDAKEPKGYYYHETKIDADIDEE